MSGRDLLQGGWLGIGNDDGLRLLAIDAELIIIITVALAIRSGLNLISDGVVQVEAGCFV